MGVGAGLYMYDVVVEKFTFAISSPDEFLSAISRKRCGIELLLITNRKLCRPTGFRLVASSLILNGQKQRSAFSAVAELLFQSV